MFPGKKRNNVISDRLFFLYSAGEFHCYCNSPICTSTNYMCESQVGCYSQLVVSQGDSNDPYFHGCIESITVEKCDEVTTTNNATAVTPFETASSSKKEMSCCYESMCNFQDRSKVNDDVVSRDNFGKLTN